MSEQAGNAQASHGLRPGPSAARVLSIVEGMRSELRGNVDLPEVRLSSHLELDVGLDSLSRMELLARLESEVGFCLDQESFINAETVADLLQALRAAPHFPGIHPAEPVKGGEPTAFTGDPLAQPTLLAAVRWHLRTHPGRVHLKLLGEGGERELSYAELYSGASAVAFGLVHNDIGVGDAVAIMLPTDVSYLQSFLACMLVGAVPVPIYPPARPKQLEEHFARHIRILDNAQVRMLITFEQALTVSQLLGAPVTSLTRVVTPGQLRDAPRVPLAHEPAPSDIAFLQYTSGSTGDPKGVVLTHANVMASLNAMARALDAGPTDVFVSWLPLYHDMGLIGAWFGSLVVGFPLVLMSPLTFLARPQRWLEAISRHHGTISGGPNFAYELCVRRIPPEVIDGLDLSRWRAAFNGAEPVSAGTLRQFAERFQRCGLAPGALTPVYGLAEATLGVAFTPPSRGPRVERVERDALYHRDLARPVFDTAVATEVVECVSSGVPIPGFEVRIVSPAGVEVPERVVGAVQFRGPGATPGYFRNPVASRGLKIQDWTATGDRGFTLDGELFITGRDKDLVIRAGRNLYPYALEQAVAEVPGVRRGCVAVFASTDPARGTESLVVLAETRESDAAVRERMQRDIEALALEHLGLAADRVVLAAPHTVLKTSSGKIRRAALAASYADGTLARAGDRAVPLQLLRLAMGAVAPWTRALVARARRGLFTAWCLLALALTVLVTWPAVVMARSRESAWRRARRAAWILFPLCGIRLRVDGEGPPRQPCVLVSNHQSYLDGLALVAALPGPVCFVAKRELSGPFISRRFLEALGVLFVERFDRRRAVADANALVAALEAGDSVFFFAEGTFHRMAGLLPFQLGAFETALRAGVPIAPVVIKGSRHVLRGDDLSPNRGTIQLRWLPLAQPGPVEACQRWAAALQLRQRVRGMLLEQCGEPDLGGHGLRTRLEEHRA